MEAIKTYKSKDGRVLKIYYDQNAESPREWDNIGTIAYKHDHYNLGEEKIDDPIDWLISILGYNDIDNYKPTVLAPANYEVGYNNATLRFLEAEFMEKFPALPIYLYDHSGQTISTKPFSCPWDSGQVGYIYATPEKINEINPEDKSKEKILEYLQGEIDTFDQYIRGEVYGFEEFASEKDAEDDNTTDSCWGFYDIEQILSEQDFEKEEEI